MSVTTKPQVTLHSTARVDSLLRVLERLRSTDVADVRLTHLLARVTACALVGQPSLNGWVKDETITLSPVANLGVAVQASDMLLTPVLAEANRVSFADLVGRLNDLIERARAGKLHPRELAGGTFTLTSLGASHVHHFTPIVNPPQLAILGVGRVATVPRWDGAAWQPVAEIPLSLTFDHGAVDGQPAALFLDRLIVAIEEPPEALWR